MEEKLLEIRNLNVVFKTDNALIHAVNGIDFSIGTHETIGLVGETGAGKTTTARAIMRLLPERTGRITDGEIIYRGKDLLKFSNPAMREIRGSRISMIFQDPMTSLNPIMTIGAQILESLEIHNAQHKSKAELNAQTDELLALVGINPGRKGEYPHQFSGGMKQRVVIAIALACEPELLIADEPTTALDVTIQAQVLELMDNLKKKLGTSIIMITHDLGVVAETCDKVAIIYAGEIIEAGTARDIFENKSHHPYTAGLFNSIPDIHVHSKRLSPIEGLMADPTDLPTGCKFHPRCKHCTDRCQTDIPARYESNGHIIRCHLFA